MKMNVLEDEEITNQVLNYKIHTLHYSDASWESISNLALENISKINPQKLYQLILNVWKVILILNIDTSFNIIVLHYVIFLIIC